MKNIVKFIEKIFSYTNFVFVGTCAFYAIVCVFYFIFETPWLLFGAVVLNRVEHPSFPSTISGVVYQRGAFNCLDDGQFDKPVADSAYKAARDALNGWAPSGGAIYYFNPSTATSNWIWSRPHITTIGKHRFCG